MGNDRLTQLFSPYDLRHISLKNRIVSTAHGTYMLKEGLQTRQIAAYHEARARGGVGLIILEATSTHPTGIGAPIYAVADTDACIPGYRTVIDAIHAHGIPTFVQLYHPGHDDIAGSSSDGAVAVAYSSSQALCEGNQLMARAMSVKLIKEVVESYGAAARRLLQAGADGIEISAHHGHLVCQFLDPRVNRRTDEYGGDFAGRFRLLREIITEVRVAIGERPILGVRLTCGERSAAGITTQEAVQVAVEVDGLPAVDYIHVTPGSCATFDGASHVVASMAFPAGYAAEDFRAIRERVRKPLIATGRINDPTVAERLLGSGVADLVGMTRALICDPEMPAKARENRGEDIRYCIACNQACIGHGRRGGFVTCIQNPASGRELIYGSLPPPAHKRKVLVAGGGPAGMKAAVVAAERGHAVTLYERGSRLGGQARLAEMLPGRAEFGGLITNLESELRRFGVKVVLNQAVTREDVDRERPDCVIIATGAQPYKPEVPGDDELQVVHAWDVVSGKANVGASVVIADGKLDWVALGVAQKLALAGCSVRLCASGYTAGEQLPYGVKGQLLGVLHGLNVPITPLMRLAGCAGGAVFFEHATSHQAVSFEGIDTLVLSLGGISDTQLEEELVGYGGDVHLIGDCLAPRTAEEAILEGLRVAAQL